MDCNGIKSLQRQVCVYTPRHTRLRIMCVAAKNIKIMSKIDSRVTALEEQLSNISESLDALTRLLAEAKAPANTTKTTKTAKAAPAKAGAKKAPAKAAAKKTPVITGKILAKTGKFTVTQYSPNSLALYGAGESTRPFAPALKRAGGRWGWQQENQCWWFSANRHTPATILRLVK